MTRYIKYTFIAVLALIFASCQKDEVPMTSTVDLAGEWMVTAYVGDEAIAGPFMVLTYNTNTDDGQELWLNELGNFWNPALLVKVPCKVGDKTFGSDKSLKNLNANPDGTDFTVVVKNGKVVFGGATTPSGMPADAIEYQVEYSDDPGTVYTFKGYRRTGFTADEQ